MLTIPLFSDETVLAAHQVGEAPQSWRYLCAASIFAHLMIQHCTYFTLTGFGFVFGLFCAGGQAVAHHIKRENWSISAVLVQIFLCVIVYSVRLCSLIGPGLEWLVAGSKSATTEWKSWWAGVQPGVPHSPPWQELHSMLEIISIHELKMMIQAPSGGHPDVLHSPAWQELLTILWMQIHLYRDMSCIYLDCTARGYNTEVC